MKIALCITGNVGTRLLAELLRRGHEVTGIARNPDKVALQLGLTTKRGDLKNEVELVQLLAGHYAVIHSVMFRSSDPHKVLNATKKAGVKRLLVVGGAGSLAVAPNVQLLDAPEFPDIYKVEALAGRDFLNVLRTENEQDWTFLSPSALFVPGERTGKFRLGTDELLIGANGESKISMEDFAMALVDELENPKHSRQRFTIGY